MSARFEVSVVIPVRDGVPFVLEAVESVLAQSHPAVEIIVVDDHSQDATAAMLRAAFDSRIRLIQGRFDGAAGARNAGWRMARSEWVGFLDADDLWSKEKLEVAAVTLAQAPEASWFFSDGSFLTLEGDTHPSWLHTHAELRGPYVGQPLAELFEINFILTSAVIVRREVLEAVGGFNPAMSHAEDLDLWIRLARCWPLVASPRSLVCYRHRPESLSRQVTERLAGDIDLFQRLVADQELSPRLRRLARRREALCHYKLAVQALREGQQAEARAALRSAWIFPERAWPVVAAWGASLLPPSWLGRLRRQHWAVRPAARSMVRHPHVVLDGDAGRARPGGREA